MSKSKPNYSFLRPKFVEKQINDQPVRFYAIPYATFSDLQDSATDLVQGIVMVFRDRGIEGGTRSEKMQDLAEGGIVEKTEILPVGVDLAKYRDAHLREAISRLTGELSSPKVKTSLAKAVMSSMRDVFGKGPYSDEDANEFLNNPDLDVETLTSLVTGMVEASRGMLGPLAPMAGKIWALVKARIEELTVALGSEDVDGSSEDSTTTE